MKLTGLRISRTPRKIVIEMPLSVLRTALRYGSFNLDSRGDPAFRITDLQTFADGVIENLGNEDEVGLTSLHRAFDEAILATVEDGDGSEEYQRSIRRRRRAASPEAPE